MPGGVSVTAGELNTQQAAAAAITPAGTAAGTAAGGEEQLGQAQAPSRREAAPLCWRLAAPGRGMHAAGGVRLHAVCGADAVLVPARALSCTWALCWGPSSKGAA